MKLSFAKPLLFDRAARSRGARGCTIINKIGALAQSSHDLNTALRLAADEIGAQLGLERVAIVLQHEGGFRRAGDYCAPKIGPVEREKLRQLDSEITSELSSQLSLIEIANAGSDERVSRLMKNAANRAHRPEVKAILIVPLVINSQTAGAVLLYQRNRQHWSEQDKHLAQAVASTLALTVHHFKSQERATSASDREGLTNKLLTAIRNAVGVDEILKVAVDGIGKTLKVGRVAIYMHNGAGKPDKCDFTARAEYRSSVLVPSVLNTELDLEGSPVLERVLSGEVIDVPDTNQSDPIMRAISVRLGVRALALAPIRYNGQTVAMMSLEQFDHPHVFSQAEMMLLELATEQIAVALYQAELYREAQDAARRDALISRISSAIHSSLDPDAVLQAIVSELGAALSVCRCRLALLPTPLPEMVPVTNEYVAECCASRPALLSDIRTVNNPFLQSVLAREDPVSASDPANDPIFAPLRRRVEAGSLKAILTTAIRIGGRPIGILSLHHCEQPHAFTQWEADLVKSVADQAAVAIRQAELYREVREFAKRASLVNEIVGSIRGSLDLKEILQVAVEEVGRALGANRTYFRTLAGPDSVVVAESLTDPGLSLFHVKTSFDDYITNYLIENRRTLVIDDVRAFAAAYPNLASTVRIWQVEPVNLSQIVCPIFVNGAYWGGLSIGQTDRARKWTASEIALVEMVAAQVEVAVSHSNLFQETKQSAEREALISHIIHGVNQSNRVDEIFPIAARELGGYLAADKILVTDFNRNTAHWITECQYSEGTVSNPERAYRQEDVAGFFALAENGIIVCNDAEADPRLDDKLRSILRTAGTRSFISVPLLYGEDTRLMISAVMKSGARRWTQDEIEVVRAVASQVVIALERAELFELVSRAKLEWEATFDALNDGILIFDQSGALKRVNQAGAAYEGVNVRELIGRRCCTLLQGVEGETCRVAQVIKSGRPVTFELVPERLARPVLVTISPLANDPESHSQGAVSNGNKDANNDGNNDNNNGHHETPRGAVCIVRDLSELRAAEAAAREQRSYLVKLIEHANDAILAFSPEGRLIWFNEQLARQSGYSRAELEAGDYRLFVFGDQKKLAIERFTRALEGEAQTYEMNVVRKSGENRLLLITYTPIYDEGRVTSILSIARDITEERTTRERAAQADKLRALGQLASGVAHNFNNILAAILGHAQLIKRDCRDERIVERMDIIEYAALDGAQTVRRIQAFGAQQKESASDEVEINQLVQDSTNLTRTRWFDEAQARGLHYAVELEFQAVPSVAGSASELREVFVNIILNALDAMPQGGRLHVATETRGGFAHVSFTDDGIGMAAETCDRIFEPFFTTKGANGTGLGLAVSHSIVERHGGRIEVVSSPGRGTTFTVSLPVVHQRAPRENAPLVRTASVLVVDDDQRVREALVGMLSSSGHRTDHAGSGREALEKLERDRFDLVLTDLSMPEMDGWAVAGEVRRRWPDVKVVLITGHSVPPETVDNNRDLVSEVMFKPIRLDDLSSTMSQVLS
jgi:PAS domain S-box-containing protein